MCRWRWGEKLLLSALGRAGVEDAKGDHIELKVVLGDDVDEAIRAEVDEGGYGLVLMGASDVSSVRRKLFGTIPDRVVLEEKSTLAVIRRARPLGERVKERVGRAFDLTVPQLRREERINLFAELEGKSRWSFDFMALICLSTAIASLGLLQNSVAVVIGAMLVAPLMTPLLGAGLALVQGNGPLMRSSVKAIVYGFLMAVVIGVCVGALGKPMTGLTGEMLARGEPSLWDMGVGFLSGVAASYCIARPGLSSALAGGGDRGGAGAADRDGGDVAGAGGAGERAWGGVIIRDERGGDRVGGGGEFLWGGDPRAEGIGDGAVGEADDFWSGGVSGGVGGAAGFGDCREGVGEPAAAGWACCFGGVEGRY